MNGNNTKYSGVIFDMDGTLIDSRLDFQAIRADLGIPAGVDILAHLEALPVEQQGQAHEKLLAHELTAARNASLMPGAGELLATLRQHDIKTALLTRNTRQAVDIAMERFPEMRFDLVFSREDGKIKPEPDGVLEACRKLNVQPAYVVCVGDFHYDIIAANAAGAVSVLLTTFAGWRDFAHEADFVIGQITELKGILKI